MSLNLLMKLTCNSDQEYSFVSSDKEIEDDAVVELFESFAASNPMTISLNRKLLDHKQ